MATLSEADCRRMYSWWWDSHISPKNSKWLHDNLTDINAKVKTMIKLIEEDADSFAKRAEMYYKKRPELMKLVEEFYRAYRALAERYDHATGALHQAHRSMAEAFPNQIPLLMADDSAANDMSTPVHTLKQVDDLFGYGGHSRFSEGKSRRRLTFDDVEAESCGDERSNKSIRSKFDLLTAKLESQSQELAEKDRELERLWVCIEDERTRFNDLQNVNSQAEEELKSMARILRETDTHDQSLQHELDESKKKIQELGFKLESTMTKLTNKNENLQVNFERERSEKASLMEELLGKISRLESCLVDANDELEVLKAKSKSLEDSCHVLVKQNAGLITENESLNSHKQKLEDMDKRFNELEKKYLDLEKEKQRTLFKVEELKVSLEGQKEEQVNFSNISESRLSGIESRIRLLQEESRQKNQELVEELDKALNSQIESFVLRKCVQELEEKNSDLFIECQKLLETSESSENLISKLEIESREHQMKAEKENLTLLGEILSSTFLSVIFKELVSEKSEEMKQIQENVKVLQKENLNLKEALQKSEHELITATFFTDQLNYEVANGKNVVKQKEMEVREARWKLESTENQNWGLLVQVDDLKTKYNEQTKLIFKLSEENDRLNKENKCIADDLVQLHQEHEESQKREQKFKDLNAKLNILERENGQNFHSEKTKDNEFVGLQDLLNRVEAIERTLNSKKQEATQNPKPEISEVESKCLTKEIMLDQTSECELSHGRNSREAESQLVELWETVDHDSSIDLTVGRSNNNDIEYRQLLSVKTKNRFRHEEFTGDELDLSKRLAENRREGSKRKILEKLNSDVQKLTNLQITVQDLKNKVKTVKADVECDSVIVELEEAEVAIEKLFDINDKLVKSFQDKKSSKETMENGSVSRRKIQEQARRASDKIGRLQLEIQKLQFVLMKIDDEKESRGKAGIVLDSKKRILLRDYIYGGVRQSPRRKKSAFCGCIQPPTKG